MKYGDLTYEEIQERAGQGWLAIVPTVCPTRSALSSALHLPLTAIRYASPCLNNPPSSYTSPRTGPAPSPSQPIPTTSNTTKLSKD